MPPWRPSPAKKNKIPFESNPKKSILRRSNASVTPPHTHASFCSTGQRPVPSYFPAPTDTCHCEKPGKTEAESLGSVLSGVGCSTIPPLLSCVALAGWLTLAVPQTPRLENRDDVRKQLGRASVHLNCMMLFTSARTHTCRGPAPADPGYSKERRLGEGQGITA